MADETPTTETAAPEPSWRDTLPDDLKADPSLADFKGKDWTEAGPVLAKSYIETKKMVGQGGLKVPAGDAPDEEWAAFYAKAGRPESPDKYALDVPKFPEGMGEIDPEGVSQFRKEAHAAGLTDKQAQRLMSWYGTYSVGTLDRVVTQTATQRKAAETALKAEWGAAYPRNLALARQAVKDLAEDDAQLAAAVEDAGNNVAFVKFLTRVGERMLEHGEITGTIAQGETLVDLEAKINKMAADPNANNWPKTTLDEYAALLVRAQRLRERTRP